MPAGSAEGQVTVAAGNLHTCAFSSQGLISCWGSNDYGQTTVPTAANANVVWLASGFGHSCAVNGGGMVFCWGFNNVYQV